MLVTPGFLDTLMGASTLRTLHCIADTMTFDQAAVIAKGLGGLMTLKLLHMCQNPQVLALPKDALQRATHPAVAIMDQVVGLKQLADLVMDVDGKRNNFVFSPRSLLHCLSSIVLGSIASKKDVCKLILQLPPVTVTLIDLYG
ncbi:hypothetical protein GGF32_007968, partial [Allomyces javanicus]